MAKAKAGRVAIQDLMKMVNKKAGRNVAHDLTGENPTSVKEWIPTGSRWLDSIISKGHRAGIPVGKVTEIAGLESTGKSYMAAQIAANAQKTGKLIVYFDSESAIDPRVLGAGRMRPRAINVHSGIFCGVCVGDRGGIAWSSRRSTTVHLGLAWHLHLLSLMLREILTPNHRWQ